MAGNTSELMNKLNIESDSEECQTQVSLSLLNNTNEDELREACGVFGLVLSKERYNRRTTLTAEEKAELVQDNSSASSTCSVGNSSAEDNIQEANVSVAKVVQLGLVALQHRGQESAGIVTSEGRNASHYHYHKGQGLVAQVFNDQILNKLTGIVGLGHTRYSTAGGGDAINTQPFLVHTRHGPIAVAHNGELINAENLRQTVLERGVGLSTKSDSELITQMLSLTPPRGEKKGPDWGARIRHLMEATPMAYSLVLLHGEKLYGVRDSFGNRPLCIGKLMPVGEYGMDGPMSSNEEALGWILSSESCAFQSIGAKYVREVAPGEIVELSPRGIRTLDIVPRPKKQQISIAYSNSNGVNDLPPAFCIFEYVYFSRPDSVFEGQQVYTVRHRCGIQLALEAPVEADIVSTVPESATPAALGFALQSKIPYVEVLCKNRYVGRSFIQPCTRSRKLAVARKFGAITDNLAGRRVVLIDDSIVRGTTVGPIIKLLRNAGAKEVHIRVASPPIKHPCYMGINIPTKSELVANTCPTEQLAKHFGADSLKYLSIEGLVKAVRQGIDVKDNNSVGHCTACLDGHYPVELEW